MQAGDILTANEAEEIEAMREIVQDVATAVIIPAPMGLTAKILKAETIMQAHVLMRPLTRKFTVMIDVEDKTISSEKMAMAIYKAIRYAMENDIDDADCLNEHDCGEVSVDPV